MTRRAIKPAEVSSDDLQALVKLEGRTLPRGQALADLLEVSHSSAWRTVRRLKRAGALGSVAAVRLRPETCECVTYLRMDWTHTAGVPGIEDRIAHDPAIVAAARVTGGYDYRLQSVHADYRLANAWSRELQAHPHVARILTKFCRTIFDRPRYAAAILGSD